jgi:hypothetical protein
MKKPKRIKMNFKDTVSSKKLWKIVRVCCEGNCAIGKPRKCWQRLCGSLRIEGRSFDVSEEGKHCPGF